MGNGTILGSTLVYEAGADLHDRFNIAIVSEGYVDARMPQFHADVDKLVALITQNPAIDAHAITLTRIDVTSQQGGVDVPGLSPVDTYFDGAFDPGSGVLSVDDQKVSDTVAQQIALQGSDIAVRKIIVLIDTLAAGGGGSSVEVGGAAAAIAVASNQVDFQTVLHELGHTFGLGDEYAGAPWMDTSPPNVSHTAARDQLSSLWQQALTSGVALPTPDGTPATTVGAFEIQSQPDERYRPMHDCKMKSISDPFCTVCANAIRSQILKGNSDD